MKKLILLSAVAATLLVGCTKEEEKPPKIDTEEKAPEEKKVEIKNYTGLVFDLDAQLKEDAIDVTVSLENTSDTTIPLYLKEEKLIKLRVTDEKGNVVAEQTISEKNRGKVQTKEKVKWNAKIPLTEKSALFNMTAELLVWDRENEVYKKEELKTSKELKGNKKKLTYLPSEEKVYIYNEVSDGMEVKEEYLYFDEGYVQSKNTTEGTKVYLQDEEGVHVVYMNDYNEIKENIIDQIDPEKKTILKFPIKVGTMWKVDDVFYEIVKTDEVIETPYYDFTDVVVVKLSNGVEFFYHESVGLIQMNANDQSVLELQDIR